MSTDWHSGVWIAAWMFAAGLDLALGGWWILAALFFILFTITEIRDMKKKEAE